MNKIQEMLCTVFTIKQIEALKDAYLFGFWGDNEVNFSDGEHWGIGCCTNDIKKGKHFSGKQISGIVSSISQRIDSTKTNMVACYPDWWGDGTGDMVFFNYESFGYNNSDEAIKAFDEWVTNN